MAQITRRAALGASALLAMPALAQPRFPDRPIRLIIPWAAGGPAGRRTSSRGLSAGRRMGGQAGSQGIGQTNGQTLRYGQTGGQAAGMT